jgi:tetratricopeptide (TPR) repeat protein
LSFLALCREESLGQSLALRLLKWKVGVETQFVTFSLDWHLRVDRECIAAYDIQSSQAHYSTTEEQFVMRTSIELGRLGLLVLGMLVLTHSVQAAKKTRSEEQAAALLKWARTYLEQGKYKQSEQAAQLALELAPEDPEIVAALKLARRLQSLSDSKAEVEIQLEKVLQKLNQMERHLRDLEAKNRQHTRIQIAKEPPGSPDAGY